tara:strand:+ start:1978 stop:2556 length:579 start_codon:yes stop_codon:yes gene_type:complete
MKNNSDIYNARNAIDKIGKEKVEEAPYGFLDRMKDAAVTAFGNDAASAQAQGSAITKKRAADLYNAMKMWVGRKQLNPKNITLDEISAFLKEFGFKDPIIQDAAKKSGVKSGVAAQQKQIDSMLVAISSNIGADGQMPGTKGAGAPNAGSPQPATNKKPGKADQVIKTIQGMDKANQDALLKYLQQSLKQGA